MYRSLSLVVMVLGILVFSCLTASPTPEQQSRIAQLEGELAQVQAEIKAAEEDERTYSGGLIQTLIALRLEICEPVMPSFSRGFTLWRAVPKSTSSCQGWSLTRDGSQSTGGD